jgi:Ribbon-helix-helix protein, copG family
MARTKTVFLGEDLQARLEEKSRSEGRSVSALVRESLWTYLGEDQGSREKEEISAPIQEVSEEAPVELQGVGDDRPKVEEDSPAESPSISLIGMRLIAALGRLQRPVSAQLVAARTGFSPEVVKEELGRLVEEGAVDQDYDRAADEDVFCLTE